jgi:hypothetical protein
MTCGALRDVDECWCKTFPRLPENEVISDEGCICPSCLGRRLEVILQKEIEAHGVDGLISLAQPALPDANTAIPECHALEEFIDYRLEDGAYVFSAWFHLKRGYCCGSGCRNCPFD